MFSNIRILVLPAMESARVIGLISHAEICSVDRYTFSLLISSFTTNQTKQKQKRKTQRIGDQFPKDHLNDLT